MSSSKFFWPLFVEFTNYKKDPLEDNVDRVSTWIASSLMLVFCTIASVGFFNGNHMECMVPSEYPNNDWKKFFSSYCYVQPHVFLYEDPSEPLLRSEIAYFPWIPFFFFLHAFVFYFPKLIWSGLSLSCGFDLEGILTQAKELYGHSGETRKEKMKMLASNLMDNLRFVSGGSSPRYFLFSLTPVMFLLKKWLIVALSIIQFNIICHYIGNGSSSWGFEALTNISKKTWDMTNSSPLFPLFSWCRVSVFEDNQLTDKTASCVLGMNVIYEKLYIVTYFLLLFIIVLSSISAGYYTIVMICAYIRNNIVGNMLGFKDLLMPFNHDPKFTHDILGANGLLAMLLVKTNFGTTMAEDLLKELWAHNEEMRTSELFKDNKNRDVFKMPPPPNFDRKESLDQSVTFSLPPHYTTLPLSPVSPDDV